MNMAIAGGGTGGHLFPGIAIAEEFLRRAPHNQVLFIGTERGLESRILPQRGFQLQTIRVRGLKGQGMAAQLIALSMLPWAFIRSWFCLRRFQAHIVCGVGGYISGPAVLAGVVMGITTVIHEQNSFPGLSNRILGRYLDRVCVSYRESLEFFPGNRTVFTGLPLRREFVQARMPQRQEAFTILVLGGSQGSREINQAMKAALPYLLPVKDRIQIIHQSGPADAALLADTYHRYGIRAQVIAFIDDMTGAYGNAHLVISRAGAGTLAEITCCGRAALLIPYPHAANNHQEKNARVLVDAEAALMILSRELNGEKLARAIIETERDRSRLAYMEQRVQSLARPKAAQDIVDLCYQQVAERVGNGRVADN